MTNADWDLVPSVTQAQKYSNKDNDKCW
jgi:hypothetical protein